MVTPAGGVPYYQPVGREVEIFRAAHESRLPVMLKGPTGSGKTRLVEHMAHRLGVAVFTVSCHEDMTASDLLGRYVLQGGDTVWVDGPLTRAVREGGICYLDEVVEARQDAVVAIHSLADHRRELSIERLGGTTLRAAEGFGLVVSFNPGYQSVLKDLKPSTRQRLVSIELGFPAPEIERAIVREEAGVGDDVADDLVRLAGAIRGIAEGGLREVASTRTLVAAATLVRAGLGFEEAALSAIAGPLTDDAVIRDGLLRMIRTYDGTDVAARR
ncbi:CbbQ/NirQ/NorQ/GpvN family protein [Actinomycetospora sp. TBRC 11914]|uniref:CbbQ/NirQ/NorQ/GpvN family protein n=1 Tax=Actinomycetospora sp. TBRC 11914 TaxID=2729387 RepID=UPI00145CEBC2|nr:CbbQ/NirQ/NorQ/GpvN family protein [Actinomycetospora sp. TBRC 11914]NMO91694.1 CbbQ/NirQ/NorQ/GpvN family protein [Actinomycetospora sp. TBRC 11914]